MGWDCLRYRKQLRLWAGGDLPESDRSKLEIHLAHCSSCSLAARNHEDAYGALLSCCECDAEEEEEYESLWGEVRARMGSPAPAMERGRSIFPVAGLALAATIMLVTVVIMVQVEADPVARVTAVDAVPALPLLPDPIDTHPVVLPLRNTPVILDGQPGPYRIRLGVPTQHADYPLKLGTPVGFVPEEL